ncbi:MAG: endonuclease domain-containing protein [Bacillota bacterium]
MKLTGPEATKNRARQLRSSMSLPERILWRQLRLKRTGLRFRKQHPAGPYVLDFYCHEAKLCVEIDGQSHDFIAEHDERRDRWLALQGVRTVRVSARDVLRNLDGVVQYIVAEARAPSVARRATSPPAGGWGVVQTQQ